MGVGMVGIMEFRTPIPTPTPAGGILATAITRATIPRIPSIRRTPTAAMVQPELLAIPVEVLMVSEAVVMMALVHPAPEPLLIFRQVFDRPGQQATEQGRRSLPELQQHEVDALR